MTTLDARGRIMGGDPRYGRLCECGNLKCWQARMCQRCWFESRRDETYWQRRTCPECGGPKCDESVRCRRCANLRLSGLTAVGRPQLVSHPWRKQRLAA